MYSWRRGYYGFFFFRYFYVLKLCKIYGLLGYGEKNKMVFKFIVVVRVILELKIVD